MNAYFIYSPKSKDSLPNYINQVRAVFSDLDLLEKNKFCEDVNFGNLNGSELVLANNRVKKNIRLADVCIFEVSTHSIGVGGLLYYALSIRKAVIVLYPRGKCPQLIDGEEDPNFQLIEYSPTDIKKVLKRAILEATRQQEVRFNLMIPVSMSNFLDNEAKKRQLSKASLIRNLIKQLQVSPTN